jgi:hypothetical protein
MRQLFAIPAFLLFICLSFLSACERQQTPPSAPQKPTAVILDFSATRSAIISGEKTQLHWKTSGAKAVKLTPDIGNLNSQGSIEVSPIVTSSYELHLIDQHGVARSASLTINVTQTPIARASYPILFVTQVPIKGDVNARLSAFANHLTSPDKVPRGGDLMLRYPDGVLRNLTKEAQLGMTGLQGRDAIAVREPSVHWNGEKALFSMLLGSPGKYQDQMSGRWQIYEVSGLKKNTPVKINKIAFQDVHYNNVSPIYASDDAVIFTSDRPRSGEPHLYPQLDEYEATPSISGIWKMQPENGHLRLLSHTPSGAFSPIIDSFGRIIFTRWDHLQQDQLADRDRDAAHNKVALPFNSFNYSSERSNALMLKDRSEIFPESRVGSKSVYGAVNAFRNNFFTIWQMNQDGTSEETLNHIGQHELSTGYLTPSFADDKNLSNRTLEKIHMNRLAIRREGGLFHVQEDPLEPGSFFAINARESGSFTTDTIVKMKGAPHLNPEQMTVHAITAPNKADNLTDGRFRNPLPLSDGKVIASHTSNQFPPEEEQSLNDLRLKYLRLDARTGF